MALVQCPECKTGISDKAEKCPKCGFPNPKWNFLNLLVKNLWRGLGIGGIGAFFLLASFFFDGSKILTKSLYWFAYLLLIVSFLIGGVVAVRKQKIPGLIGYWIGLLGGWFLVNVLHITVSVFRP